MEVPLVPLEIRGWRGRDGEEWDSMGMLGRCGEERVTSVNLATGRRGYFMVEVCRYYEKQLIKCSVVVRDAMTKADQSYSYKRKGFTGVCLLSMIITALAR